MNTRLQVEHPITEITTDTDLVRLQLHVAAGGALDGRASRPRSATPSRPGSTPRTPTATSPRHPDASSCSSCPAVPGIRVDTGVGEGDTIPADFDSMIAKIIATGRTRDEALARLRRAVAETAVVIEGGATNKSFILDLLDQPEVIDATADTGWIDRVRAEGRLVSDRHSGIALVAAGIEAYEDDEQVELAGCWRPPAAAARRCSTGSARPVDLKLRGQAYKVAVSRIGAGALPGPWCARTARRSGRAPTVERLGTHRMRLVVGRPRLPRGHRDARPGPLRRGRRRRAPGQPRRGRRAALPRAGAGRRHPGRGRRRGRRRRAGARARVDEDGDAAQRAVRRDRPRAARVGRQPGRDRRAAGPAGADRRRRRGHRRPASVDLDLPDDRPRHRARTLAEHARRPERGAARLRRRSRRRRRRRSAATCAGATRRPRAAPTSLRGEIDLLGVFADFAELSPQPARPTRRRAPSCGCTARASTSTPTCRASTSTAAALPELFSVKLQRGAGALRRHRRSTAPRNSRRRCSGSSSPSSAPSPTSPSSPRSCSAGTPSRPPTPTAPCWCARCSTGWCSPPSCASRPSATSPAACGSAGSTSRSPSRSARRRWPGCAARSSTWPQHPDAPDRAERIDALAAIPEPIVSFLGERLADGVPEHEPLLEVLIRRHYREYELDDLRVADRRRPAVRRRRLRPRRAAEPSGVRPSAPFDELSADGSLGRGHRAAARPPAGREQQGVVDLYLAWPDAPDDAEDACRALRDRLTPVPFAHGVRRVAIGVCCTGRPVTYFTFRPTATAGSSRTTWSAACTRWSGRRLDLWRLRDFDITRLDAPEDVLLYHCVARENEADQRLVALAQVRELAVVRDEDGRVSVAAAGRAGHRQLRRGDPAGAGAARLAGQRARHEPRLGAHLAAPSRPSSTS